MLDQSNIKLIHCNLSDSSLRQDLLIHLLHVTPTLCKSTKRQKQNKKTKTLGPIFVETDSKQEKINNRLNFFPQRKYFFGSPGFQKYLSLTRSGRIGIPTKTTTIRTNRVVKNVEDDVYAGIKDGLSVAKHRATLHCEMDGAKWLMTSLFKRLFALHN